MSVRDDGMTRLEQRTQPRLIKSYQRLIELE
jgi:hypothetical protein